MKIAITGVHSSGKTTLAKQCSEHFGLKLVRGDTIREIIRKYFPGKSYRSLTKEEYWKLENIGLAERIRAEKSCGAFVSDGCTLNSIAYARAEIGDEVVRLEGYTEFCNLARNNARYYDFIIYLPPEIPLTDDGFRPLDSEFRSRVDQILLEIFNDYTFYTVKGSVKERLEQVERIIGAEKKARD